MRLPFVFAACLVALGCSSTETSGGTTPTDSGQTSDTGKADSGTKTDSSTVADTGKPPSDAGEDTAGIKCGSAVCGTGQVCCAAGDADAGFTFTCAATCPSGGGVIACDGPEECKTGAPICCAEVIVEGTAPACTFKSGVAECRSTCPSNIPLTCPTKATVRPCHKGSDCTETGYLNCCEFESGGSSATFCADDTMKFLAIGCF